MGILTGFILGCFGGLLFFGFYFFSNRLLKFSYTGDQVCQVKNDFTDPFEIQTQWKCPVSFFSTKQK